MKMSYQLRLILLRSLIPIHLVSPIEPKVNKRKTVLIALLLILERRATLVGAYRIENFENLGKKSFSKYCPKHFCNLSQHPIFALIFKVGLLKDAPKDTTTIVDNLIGEFEKLDASSSAKEES